MGATCHKFAFVVAWHPTNDYEKMKDFFDFLKTT
jgi:hypothetical protein